MNITLTGPRSVGKSTIGRLLAKKLKLKYISSDELGDRVLKKQGGLDKAIKSGLMKKIIKTKGYPLIKKVYRCNNNYVFDLSGGAFTYAEFPKATLEVRKIARKNSIIIGLLPSESKIYSIVFLFKREIKREHFKNTNKLFLFWKTFKKYFLFPPVFRKWANFIVYTKNKTPEEIVAEIMEQL